MAGRLHPGTAPNALLARLAGGECLTICALADDLGLTRRQVSDAAAILFSRRLLERLEAGCYRLNGEGMAAAAAGVTVTSGPRGTHGRPRHLRNSLRQRAWAAMRIRRIFTVPDLVADAEDGMDANAHDNIARYLRLLARAGYVGEAGRVAGTALTSNGFKRWKLLRNTGPKAPAARGMAGEIHDPNIGEAVPCRMG